MVLRLTAILVAAAVAPGYSQSVDPSAVVFDVASVKPSDAAPDSHGIMGPSPGGFTGYNMPLRQYVAFAYDMRPDLIMGPDWAASARFDVAAKGQAAIPLDRARIMMRNLLEERFHLSVHRETRQVPVYALVVGKEGPKHLEKAAADSPDSVRPFPLGPGKGRRFLFRNETISYLSFFLGKLAPLDRTCIDLTGLAGGFDLSLEIPDRDADTAPLDYQISVVFPAVYSQLGLKVEGRKTPTEVLVIDNADRLPTAN